MKILRIYGEHWLKASVAGKLLQNAPRGEFRGVMDAVAADYLENARAFHAPSGSMLIYTRDSGHHSSGWLKNPDFERCLHLSLSFREPFHWKIQVEFQHALADEWAELLFGESKGLAWIESPKSEIGKRFEVLHYRIFADEHWQPIHPRGEVYSTEFTEKGWKSWSELHLHSPEPSILHAG